MRAVRAGLCQISRMTALEPGIIDGIIKLNNLAQGDSSRKGLILTNNSGTESHF